MLSMLGKISADSILKYFFLFLGGDNLHEISKPIFWENKKKNNLLSTESAQRG